jgi:hypothetical protein
LSLTGYAAIATYFEERYSSNDPEIEKLLAEGEGSSWELPGRQLWIMRGRAEGLGNQLSQVWGCSLLLSPKARPISEEREEELIWPDRETSISGRNRAVFGALERVYVRDEVLMEYEGRDEFEINPDSGSVSYDGWWCVSHCDRLGRNHIWIELRKLYEGAPFDVIKHFNRFAVKRAVAEKDRELDGSRHIGERANELVYAFLELTATLARLSDAIGLGLSQEDIGQLRTDDVKYKGWWTISNLKPLGHVVPLSLPEPEFQARCQELFKLLENLAPSHLRTILIRLGIRKDVILDFMSLKLLETLCQLGRLAVREGLDLATDSSHICAKWDAKVLPKELPLLFALCDLRVAAAHRSGSSTQSRIRDALEAFGIDRNQCRAGWGKALDSVSDQIAASLRDAKQLIESAWK